MLALHALPVFSQFFLKHAAGTTFKMSAHVCLQLQFNIVFKSFGSSSGFSLINILLSVLIEL